MIAKKGWSVSGHNGGPVNGEPLTKTQLEKKKNRKETQEESFSLGCICPLEDF